MSSDPQLNEQLNSPAQPAPDSASQLDPTIEINDLTKFVTLLSHWHSVKVTELTHLLTIPDGGHVGVILSEDGVEKEHLMHGELLKGFKAGISVALTALGQLPFAVSLEDPPEKDAEKQQKSSSESPATEVQSTNQEPT